MHMYMLCCVLTSCYDWLLFPQLGVATGFLIPPMLVPNVDDMDQLAHHISIMFYGTAVVATVLFILVMACKCLRELAAV